MPGHWQEVARLSFKGERFKDHALDLTALMELSRFQKLIAETAKALYRAANPNRERLPPHFEERARLCVRAIEDGSATTPLEVYLEEPEKPELFDREPFDDLTRAVDVAFRVYSAAADETDLPEELPRELVADYANWGESLAEDEAIELRPAGQRRGVRVTRATRDRLRLRADTPYEDAADVTGEVFEADVRHRRFQIWVDSGYAVTVVFDEQQEERVTTALRDHSSMRLEVHGRGEYSPTGRLLRVTRVERLQPVRPGERVFDASARPIEDEIAEIMADVPPEVWGQLPDDLSENVDHYLYGAPKR